MIGLDFRVLAFDFRGTENCHSANQNLIVRCPNGTFSPESHEMANGGYDEYGAGPGSAQPPPAARGGPVRSLPTWSRGPPFFLSPSLPLLASVPLFFRRTVLP